LDARLPNCRLISNKSFIHTPQAEMMMEYFESFETKLAQTSLEERDIGYLKRQRFEMVHGVLT
jgi:hypothetical protein